MAESMHPTARMYTMLRRRKDFQEAKHRGRAYHCDHYVVIQLQNAIGTRRFGITASKKIGGAVKRNRVKRVLKEVFRLYAYRFPVSSDTIVIAKRGAQTLKMQEAAKEIFNCLKATQSGYNAFSPGYWST